MGNDAILTLCQEARLRYMESIEMSELKFHGHSLIQADAAIVYKAEDDFFDYEKRKVSMSPLYSINHRS